MEYTTIRISKENYKNLMDYKCDHRLKGMNAALSAIFTDLKEANEKLVQIYWRH